MNETELDAKLDALLEDWREPKVDSRFTGSVVMNLPSREKRVERVIPFPQVSGSSVAMGAAAAILLLLVVVLHHTSRMTMETDLVEQESHSRDAISELYRLTHFEGLAGMEELTPGDADMALLLYATDR